MAAMHGSMPAGCCPGFIGPTKMLLLPRHFSGVCRSKSRHASYTHASDRPRHMIVTAITSKRCCLSVRKIRARISFPLVELQAGGAPPGGEVAQDHFFEAGGVGRDRG